MEYDKTDDMMLLNTLVAPLSLNIDTTLSADVIMNEWELAIDDMKANGTGFLSEPNASDMEFETIIHATQFNEYFELNHTEHKVNRLHSDSSLLADIEIYPRPHQGFDIVYNTNAYDELTIQTLVSLIRSINMQLTHNPSKIIKDIELCNENDFKIYQNINHSTSSSHYQTVMERFEYQVEQYPNQIALQYEQQSMTYAELNHHVNRLAQYLRHTYHVQPNDIIALLAERSIEMVIGMLGILKAGAGYLPIDPDYPEDRTTFIIEDAQPKAIVTYQATIQSDIPQIELDTFDWNGDEAKLTTQVILTLMRILHTSFILQVQQVSLKGQWFLIED